MVHYLLRRAKYFSLIDMSIRSALLIEQSTLSALRSFKDEFLIFFKKFFLNSIKRFLDFLFESSRYTFQVHFCLKKKAKVAVF